MRDAVVICALGIKSLEWLIAGRKGPCEDQEGVAFRCPERGARLAKRLDMVKEQRLSPWKIMGAQVANWSVERSLSTAAPEPGISTFFYTMP